MASSTEPAVAWIGPREPALDEERQQAAMVQVGVGQHDRVETLRVEAERDPVADGLVRAPLEHAAVDQDPGPFGLEEELRTGDGGRATQEVDLHGRHGDSPHVHRGIVASMPPPNAVTRSGRLDLRAAAPRIPALMVGLVLFGFGIALMVEAGLGLGPWEALNQGIARQTGQEIGTISILLGIPILALWWPLGERPGIGTLLNVAVDRHVDEYRHRPAADTARRGHGRATRDDAGRGRGDRRRQRDLPLDRPRAGAARRPHDGCREAVRLVDQTGAHR